MSPDFTLDKHFWRNFTKTYWDRKPTVIKSPFRAPIVTPREVFRGVVTACQRLRERTNDFTLIIGDRRIVMEKDLARCLPRAKDGSIECYHARLKRAGETGELGVSLNDIQVELGWNFLTRLRQFLKGLYEIEGVPARAEAVLFLGDYSRTHEGVHRDTGSVFCFVVDGTKRMRLWPADGVKSCSPRRGPGPREDYPEHSLCLEGQPGDVIYWPASYWHVAESDGRMVTSLSIAVHYGYSLFNAMAEDIAAWSGKIIGHKYDPVGALPFSGPQVSPELASLAKRVEGESGGLAQRLTRFWMDQTTGYGFGSVPPPRPFVPLRSRRQVRTDPILPILYGRFGKELVVSTNGHSIVAPYDRDVVNLIRTLRRGAVHTLSDLLKVRRRKQVIASRKAVRKTLDFLLNERAVEYV